MVSGRSGQAGLETVDGPETRRSGHRLTSDDPLPCLPPASSASQHVSQGPQESIAAKGSWNRRTEEGEAQQEGRGREEEEGSSSLVVDDVVEGSCKDEQEAKRGQRLLRTNARICPSNDDREGNAQMRGVTTGTPRSLKNLTVFAARLAMPWR